MKRAITFSVVAIFNIVMFSPTVEAKGPGPKLIADWLLPANQKPTIKSLKNEIEWAREVAKRIEGMDHYDESVAQLNALEKKVSELAAGKASSDKIKDTYLEIRELKRTIFLSDPAIQFEKILCIDNAYAGAVFLPENRGNPQFSNNEPYHQSHSRIGYCSVSGGRLLVLNSFDPDAEPTQLAPTPDQNEGAFLRPDLSYDATKVLFSFSPKDDFSYHLYEINLDGTGLRQLTDSDLYDDNDPIYLADGNIMFTTTRSHTFVRCVAGTLSTTLALCDKDGKHIRLISRNNEPDWLPAQLPDGRVVYTRWEYSEKNVMRIQGLWTTNPDGANVEVLWGNMSTWPDNLLNPRPIPGSNRIMFSGVGHHNVFASSIGIINPGEGREYPFGLTKVTADVSFGESGDGPHRLPRASEKYHSTGAFGSYTHAYPVSPNLFLVSAHPGRLKGRGHINPKDLNRFRLYLMDMDGNMALLYSGVENIFHAMPVMPREKPPVRPSTVKWPSEDRSQQAPGYFYSVDVFEGTEIPRDIGTANLKISIRRRIQGNTKGARDVAMERRV